MKRLFLALVLAVVAFAAFFYYFARARHRTVKAPIPELILLAPPDAPCLLYADLAAFRSSPFFAQLASLAPAPAEDREYAEFVRATGFDYERDLDRVAVSVWPASPTNSAVALAEGRFDREKISHYAMRSGKLESHNGVDVYLFPNERSKTIVFAFLAENRVVLADGPALKAVLDRRTRASLAPELRERIARVAGSAFFVVGRPDSWPQNFSLGGWRTDQIDNLLRSVRWFTLAARPEGERVHVVVEGECDSPENARQLAGALDGLRLLAKAALDNPSTRSRLAPQAAALLDGVVRASDVSREDNRVRVHIELTAAMLAPSPKVPEHTQKHIPE